MNTVCTEVFQRNTSLKVRFSPFEFDHLPYSFQSSLWKELNKILVIHGEIKIARYARVPRKLTNLITPKAASYTAAPLVNPSTVPIPPKTDLKSSQEDALETKYDPKKELALSEAARSRRLSGYIPKLIFSDKLEAETVILDLPDRKEPYHYKVGYPDDSLFHLWMKTRTNYQQFLVYFCSAFKVSDEVLNNLKKPPVFNTW